jgi:hypothetical protein
MIRKRYGEAIRKSTLLNRIIGRFHKKNMEKVKDGYLAFKYLLFDDKGNKIPLKSKKGGNKDGKNRYKKDEATGKKA